MTYRDQEKVPDRATLTDYVSTEGFTVLVGHLSPLSMINTSLMHIVMPERPLDSVSVCVAGSPRAPASGAKDGRTLLEVIVVIAVVLDRGRMSA